MTSPKATRNVIVHYTERLLAKKIPGIVDSACLRDVEGTIIEPTVKHHIQNIYGLGPDLLHINPANIFYGSRLLPFGRFDNNISIGEIARDEQEIHAIVYATPSHTADNTEHVQSPLADFFRKRIRAKNSLVALLRRRLREESTKAKETEEIHKRELRTLQKKLLTAEKACRTFQESLKKSQEKVKVTEEKIDEMRQKLTRIVDKTEEEKKEQEREHNAAITPLRWIQWRGILDLGQAEMARLSKLEETSDAWREFLDQAGATTERRISHAKSALPLTFSSSPDTRDLASDHAMQVLCEKGSEIRRQGRNVAHPRSDTLSSDMKTPTTIVSPHIAYGIEAILEYLIRTSKTEMPDHDQDRL